MRNVLHARVLSECPVVPVPSSNGSGPAYAARSTKKRESQGLRLRVTSALAMETGTEGSRPARLVKPAIEMRLYLVLYSELRNGLYGIGQLRLIGWIKSLDCESRCPQVFCLV